MKLLKRLDLAYSRALTGLRRAHITPSMRGTGELMWEAGRAAGKREERKRLATKLRVADVRLRDAERRMFNAEKAATEHKMRLEATVKEANRRAAMYQSRLPATNGGYG